MSSFGIAVSWKSTTTAAAFLAHVDGRMRVVELDDDLTRAVGCRAGNRCCESRAGPVARWRRRRRWPRWAQVAPRTKAAARRPALDRASRRRCRPRRGSDTAPCCSSSGRCACGRWPRRARIDVSGPAFTSRRRLARPSAVFGKSSEIRAGLSIVKAIGSGAVPFVRRRSSSCWPGRGCTSIASSRRSCARTADVDRASARAHAAAAAKWPSHDEIFPLRTGADLSIRFTP